MTTLDRRFSDRHDLPVVAFHTLCACTAVLVVADGTFTYVWLTTGVAVEGNPIVAVLVDWLGNGPGMAVRTVVALALIATASLVAPREPRAFRIAGIGMAGLATVYTAVLLIHLNGWAQT